MCEKSSQFPILSTFWGVLVRILFRITCGVSEIIEKRNLIFALPLHVSAGIPAETCSGESSLNPPKKCSKSGIESFFHTFFAISCHVRFNTCSYVMILYPKGNLMFLNTFLILFWYQNYFCVLSATRNQNFSSKNRLETLRIRGVFGRFFVEQF